MDESDARNEFRQEIKEEIGSLPAKDRKLNIRRTFCIFPKANIYTHVLAINFTLRLFLSMRALDIARLLPTTNNLSELLKSAATSRRPSFAWSEHSREVSSFRSVINLLFGLYVAVQTAMLLNTLTDDVSHTVLQCITFLEDNSRCT